jgi:type VI secretion system secreted protein VgrG
MIAHQGQCLLQAQNNDIVGQAEKNVMLSASEGEVLIMAPKIRLVAEDGSFIRIGGGITLGTTGAVQVKAASQSMSGPATDSANLPTFGVGKADQRFMLHYPASGDARPQFAANRNYEITLKDGRVVSGVSDGDGRTSLVDSDAMQIAQVRILGGAL